MRVFRVFLNNYGEIFNCIGMVLDHLVSLGTLVDVTDVAGVLLDALKTYTGCYSQLLTTEKG